MDEPLGASDFKLRHYLEKHYVVLEGELTLVSELDGVATRAVLHALDSVRYAPGEKRQLVNHSNDQARVLLAMPLHASTAVPMASTQENTR